METLFVFLNWECTIVNLATYRQFTNAAWKTKKKTNKQTKNKNKAKKKRKEIKIALSLGYPSSYFYNKLLYLSFSWWYKVAAFCQSQCHSSCLRTWSIHRKKTPRELISLIKFRYFSFLRTALSLRLDSKPTVNSRTYSPGHIGTWTGLGKEDLDDNFHQLLLRDSEKPLTSALSDYWQSEASYW